MNVLLIANDQVIDVIGLQDAVTGQYLNEKTVVVTITDKNGNQVAGQSWPTTLEYVPASNGDYRGNLSNDMVLVRTRQYFVTIDADAGGGLVANWRWPVDAQYRKP